MIPAVAVTKSIGDGLVGEGVGGRVTIGESDDDDIENTCTTLSGTSMASANVSAAAALLWSNFEECSSHQIRCHGIPSKRRTRT